MKRVLQDWTAVRLWLALTVAGVVAGLLTVQPWWAVGGCAVGAVCSFVLVAVKARRVR